MSCYKAKQFRSQDGCCICGAKSSTSRFTGCDKYSKSFLGCFKLRKISSKDICNACVLIVKRFKKLPSNTTKDWSHVVGSKSGPGTKPSKVVRPKSKEDEENLKYKHVYKRKNSVGKENEANLKYKHVKRKNPAPRSRTDSGVTSRTESPTIPEVSVDHSLYPIF